MRVHVGVDVGGTNTDAVVVSNGVILGTAKKVTTADVTTGLCRAIGSALDATLTANQADELMIQRVHIGTTHFLNAVLQRKDLAKVGVLRLCGPTTTTLPPFCDFPKDLRETLYGSVELLDGGYEYDGQTQIRPINRQQLEDAVLRFKKQNIYNIVVSGVFSPVNSTHEDQVETMLAELFPEASLTLSHHVGQLGLLERENAAILNEALRPLASNTVNAIRVALDQLGLRCPFFLTQNDGTLLSAEQAVLMPVHTFSSGPTNSMRGAAFLSGLQDAVIVDIGGTSTDVGMLMQGFPRQAAMKVKVGGVLTNFRMPDVISIALGGGSVVRETDQVKIGPRSTGYKLVEQALVFGGDVVTASDVAVAAGLITMGDKPERAAQLSDQLVTQAVATIRNMLQDTIDQVKTSSAAVPVILVGGGSVLIDTSSPLEGTSDLVRPPHYDVANAMGAALSQVSATIDTVLTSKDGTREAALSKIQHSTIEKAVEVGAKPESVTISEVAEIPLTYVPGGATRVRVKAVGDLLMVNEGNASLWTTSITTNISEIKSDFTDKGAFQVLPADISEMAIQEKEPSINCSTSEWELSSWDIEALAVGAGILGCGGGGSPYLGKITCQELLRQKKKLRVITPERWLSQNEDNCMVVPTALMGAPTILIERLAGSTEMLSAYKGLKDVYDIQPKHDGGVTFLEDYHPERKAVYERQPKLAAVCSAEIGGTNGLIPLIIGGLLDLPVVDCDLMGRAFPQLQHCAPFIYGHPAHPACLADYNDTRNVVLQTESPTALENHYRVVCMNMGCAAALAIRALDCYDFKHENMIVRHSVSRAWRLGQAVIHARQNNSCPITAILQHSNGSLLFTGKVFDVERHTTGGFAKGKVRINGSTDFATQEMTVEFQNENLVAFVRKNISKEKQQVACVPDLITIVEQETGEPISTEEVRYGLRVAVLVLPAPPALTTARALDVVGPQAFGYPAAEVQFVPDGRDDMYVTTEPVGPK